MNQEQTAELKKKALAPTRAYDLGASIMAAATSFHSRPTFDKRQSAESDKPETTNTSESLPNTIDEKALEKLDDTKITSSE